MKRFSLFLSVASCGVLSALVACGGISDPTKSSSAESVATVSGALTGTNVPSNAHVALVWRVGNTGTYAVGSDVAVVNGSFSMNLVPPPANYFTPAESDYNSFSGGSTPPSIGGGPMPSTPPAPDGTEEDSSGPNTTPPDAGTGGSPGSSSGGSSSGMLPGVPNISPKDTVSGTITQPLTAALAGFVVYVDGNGNNQLDLVGKYADSPDQIIGGNKELMLAYLKDGGALDYEKLRDRSGILPAAGYNLAWDEGRWMPLNVVELKITTNVKLPNAVCDSSGPDSIAPYDPGGPGSSGNEPARKRPAASYYPPPSDPNLHCSADGRSWTYDGGWGECPPTPPPPVGLCANVYGSPTIACVKQSGSSLGPSADVPEGWPCDTAPNIPPPVTDAGPGPNPTDAGPAPDAGI